MSENPYITVDEVDVMLTLEPSATSEALEAKPGSSEGVRMLFNVVDPTGMLGSSESNEMFLGLLSKYLEKTVSTADYLTK